MNLGPVLEWAAAVLCLLDHPEAEARAEITPERLEEKLGWLRSFSEDIRWWRECQQVIHRGLKFMNEQGLFHGAAAQLHAAMEVDLVYPTSKHMMERLTRIIHVGWAKVA